MSQDSWTVRKGKTRISCIWKMINDHYGVRKKARKHGKWGMKQDSVAWKFRTQNLVIAYTLNLRTNLEHFIESILYIIYIILKLGKSEVQNFKHYANWSWNEEVMAIWRQLHQVGGSFRNDFEIQLMISKFNLWIRNPLRNDTNSEFTHCHFDVPPPLPRELHLKHSIRPRLTLHY